MAHCGCWNRVSGDAAKVPVVKAALDNADDLLKSQMELNNAK
jgi:hypothetical protein